MKRTFIGLLCSVAMAAQAAESYSIYENRRFNFSVDVPAILEPQGESGNGDGQLFSSKDGDATARVYGSYTGPCDAVGMIDDPQGSRVTYRFAKRGVSVVSGYRQDRIFYKKAIRKADRCLMLDIEYPTHARKIYDPITVRMANSLGG